MQSCVAQNPSQFRFPQLSETSLHTLVFPELWDRQKAREHEMVTLGIEALRRSVEQARAKGQEDNTVYGSRLTSHSLPALTAAIEAEIFEPKPNKAGRGMSYAKVMRMLSAEVLAALTLVVVMRQISATTALIPTALAVGDAVEDEIRRRKYAEADPKGFKWTKDRASKSKHQRYTARMFRDRACDAGVEAPIIPTNDKVHVGVKLIELCVKATGLCGIDRITQTPPAGAKGAKGAKAVTVLMLVPTRATLEWISERIAFCEALQPKYMPTLVPPKPWNGPFGGGYWSPEVNGRVLIKTRYRAYLDELSQRTEDMPEVYRSVNALQDTAWTVNTPVLEAAWHLWDRVGGSLAGLPPRDPQPLPPCPVCGAHLGDTSPVTAEHRERHACFDQCAPEVLRKWRIETGKLYDKYTSLTSKRLQCAKILHLAEKYREEAAFYFPHQLDFRGRAYPMPAYFQPQGNDLAKGLLRFAEAKPLGEQGVFWLAVHTANTWGEDKVSLEARVQWTEAHTPQILAVAQDPTANLWWTDADKPFQFLAACFEWAGYAHHGPTYRSGLPIAMDGTCNGLQIFALMLRDEEGGRAVNLLPSDKPQDIYGIVADKVTEALRGLAVKGEMKTREATDPETHKKTGEIVPWYDERDMAQRLLAMGVTRKTTKRQVMVVPYGGTLLSCREYTLEHLEERLEESAAVAALFPDGSQWAASVMLSKLIWVAIDETITAARTAMGFLQKLASLAAKQDLPITWTTPVGLPVLQAYKEYSSERVETHLFGHLYKPRINTENETNTLDSTRQRNGVSPNYVHSLDAAAMQHTVCIALDEGVTAFAMIHDSYGTHAADAETLARSLRNSFVDLFGGNGLNLLALVRQEVQRQTHSEDKDLPDLPPFGGLEVEEVRKSRYFFA